jgi:hypothetical protein
MPQAIKVTSRFATPYDTARVLGVPKRRAEELIRRVRQITDRMLHKDSVTIKFKAKAKSTASLSKKKNGGSNAGTKAHKTKAKSFKVRG